METERRHKLAVGKVRASLCVVVYCNACAAQLEMRHRNDWTYSGLTRRHKMRQLHALLSFNTLTSIMACYVTQGPGGRLLHAGVKLL